VQSLVEELAAPDADKSLVEKQRNLDRWISVVAGTTVSILVIWGVIYAIIIVKGAVITGSIFLAFILGVILFALLMLYRDSLAKKSSKQQPSLTKSNTAKLLCEPQIEPAPSVVERTTELLTEEKKVNSTEQIKR
jgi:hypothetical protein